MKLGFGKYKHLELEEIARTDPGYLEWALGHATVLQGKPFLRDRIQAILTGLVQAPVQTAGQADAALKAENTRLKQENMRLSCTAAEVQRLKIENERLIRENQDLEASLVQLRRQQAKIANGQEINGVGVIWKKHFKTLALLAHPDRGGSNEAMAALNEINAKLGK